MITYVVLSTVAPPSGLIIDAFGELRDQQEQVKEDMEVRLGSETVTATEFSFYLSDTDAQMWRKTLRVLSHLHGSNSPTCLPG